MSRQNLTGQPRSTAIPIAPDYFLEAESVAPRHRWCELPHGNCFELKVVAAAISSY